MDTYDTSKLENFWIWFCTSVQFNKPQTISNVATAITYLGQRRQRLKDLACPLMALAGWLRVLCMLSWHSNTKLYS